MIEGSGWLTISDYRTLQNNYNHKMTLPPKQKQEKYTIITRHAVFSVKHNYYYFLGIFHAKVCIKCYVNMGSVGSWVIIYWIRKDKKNHVMQQYIFYVRDLSSIALTFPPSFPVSVCVISCSFVMFPSKLMSRPTSVIFLSPCFVNMCLSEILSWFRPLHPGQVECSLDPYWPVILTV